MGIKTSTFGGVTLTGADAQQFLKQVNHGRPRKSASRVLAQGRKLMEEFDKKGFATIVLQPKKSDKDRP